LGPIKNEGITTSFTANSSGQFSSHGNAAVALTNEYGCEKCTIVDFKATGF